MNFCVFLILLAVVRLVFSTESNNTGNNTCNVCTVSMLRRKRANTEYTRWRGANPDAKQEFIVKVLEDDIPTTETKQIAAVNIEPITKAQEKILVRGAQVPTKESAYDKMMKEYTRFVPPTTLAVTRIDGNIVLAPVTPVVDELPPIRPLSVPKPINADTIQIIPFLSNELYDSTPAVPPFLSKSSTPVTRQYAPIAPVSFTRWNSMGALTPRTIDKFILHKTTVRPTRVSAYLDSLAPIRTSVLADFLPFNKLSLLRTSTNIAQTSVIDHEKFDEKSLRRSNLDNTVQSNKDSDKEADYNDLFYNDYDKTKKSQHLIDNYEDSKDLDHENSFYKGFNSTDDPNNLAKSKKNTVKPSINVDEEYDDDKEKCTGENKTARVSKTKINKTIENVHHKRNPVCSVLKLKPLSFNSPLTLHEIVAQLKKWAVESPVAKWVDITKGNYTVMENPIHMMIVDDLSSGQIESAKKTVMIVAGIQGRDHHAVTAAMYVLYQLIERTEAHSDLLSKFRFWIIPVFNPDGYDYSMTFPHRRQWSKNLCQSWDSCKGREACQACEQFGIRCTIKPCYGVNLDRNFEYQWIPAEELRLEHPCGALYAGPRQLSEAETRALTRFLHDQRSPLHAFIAFKEGDVLGIMYPYSHTKKRRAFDHVYRQRATQAAAAAYSISGRPYVAGQTSEFLPLYAGGIEDWVDGHLGIDITYTVMMFRPTDAQHSKLVTEPVYEAKAHAAMESLLHSRGRPVELKRIRTRTNPSGKITDVSKGVAGLGQVLRPWFSSPWTPIIIVGGVAAAIGGFAALYHDK